MNLLDSLAGAWAGFQQALDKAFIALERSKEGFRERLTKMVDAFAKDVATSRELFAAQAPFSPEVRECRMLLECWRMFVWQL